ncbi:MAG: hypothetical protein GOMPHAMPRED_005889 [Gomphillus americanus]|uniref:Uncharacterized protein n=1 Tax=Gomphillus americanus TaxID=1940652 RepID=A0A8H3FUW2_9LECA|nr:MAG: hypothetical protein GOMPHAMPRED_005889 [Gomphillus americanus]
MTKPQIYLVTGANRGIGNGIAKLLLRRPDTKVIVSCRKKDADFSWKAVGIEGQLDDMEMDMGNDSCEPIVELHQRNPDLKLDCVIAAAGMVTSMKPVAQTNRQSILDHVNVNVNGVLRLWQGFTVLQMLTPNAKFVALSSSCGSIADMEPVPGLAYGISKAGLNFLMKKIHQEHEDICSVAVHPGWVDTNMGRFAAEAWGAKKPSMEVGESAEKVLELVSLSFLSPCQAMVQMVAIVEVDGSFHIMFSTQIIHTDRYLVDRFDDPREE